MKNFKLLVVQIQMNPFGTLNVLFITNPVTSG